MGFIFFTLIYLFFPCAYAAQMPRSLKIDAPRAPPYLQRDQNLQKLLHMNRAV